MGLLTNYVNANLQRRNELARIAAQAQAQQRFMQAQMQLARDQQLRQELSAQRALAATLPRQEVSPGIEVPSVGLAVDPTTSIGGRTMPVQSTAIYRDPMAAAGFELAAAKSAPYIQAANAARTGMGQTPYAEQIGSTGAQADISGNLKTTALNRYGENVANALDPDVAAAAQNATAAATRGEMENVGAKATGASPFMETIGQLAAMANAAGASGDYYKNRASNEIAKAQVPYAAETGQTIGAGNLEGAKAAYQRNLGEASQLSEANRLGTPAAQAQLGYQTTAQGIMNPSDFSQLLRDTAKLRLGQTSQELQRQAALGSLMPTTASPLPAGLANFYRPMALGLSAPSIQDVMGYQALGNMPPQAGSGGSGGTIATNPQGRMILQGYNPDQVRIQSAR